MNIKPQISVLVASADEALAQGTYVNDLATNGVALNDGQVGLYSFNNLGSTAMNTAIAAGDTVVEAPSLYIGVGTEFSAAPAQGQTAHPLVVRPIDKSREINSNGLVSITKQSVQAPTHSTWVIGNPTTTQGIVALDNTVYQMGIAYRGRTMDEYFNALGTSHFDPIFKTPNYTAIGTANPVDHLIQNLTFNINRNSELLNIQNSNRGNEPVVAFALDTTGANGTAISALVAGTPFPVITTQNYGQVNLNPTQDMIDSFVAGLAAAGLPAGTSIVNIDRTTAGTLTADSIMLFATDRNLVFKDEVPTVKTRLEVGLKRGFDAYTVYHKEVSNAFEGQGQPRPLDILWKNTTGQRLYNLKHREIPNPQYASPVDYSTNYVIYNIRHHQKDITGWGQVHTAPITTMVLIPEGNAAAIASFEAVLTPWATSAGVTLTEV